MRRRGGGLTGIGGHLCTGGLLPLASTGLCWDSNLLNPVFLVLVLTGKPGYLQLQGAVLNFTEAIFTPQHQITSLVSYQWIPFRPSGSY